MRSKKPTKTILERRAIILQMYVLFSTLSGKDWAIMAGLPERTFYTKIGELKEASK